MIYEITDVCPHCEAENSFPWDTEKDGYVAKCTECGSPMMLCDDCRHADDNPEGMCDWHECNGWSVCWRGRYKI